MVQPFALYRFFDAHGVLLYVGCSVSMGTRTIAHGKRPRFTRVASIWIEWHTLQHDARAAERLAIETEHPLWNIQDAGCRTLCPHCGKEKSTVKLKNGRNWFICKPCRKAYSKQYYADKIKQIPGNRTDPKTFLSQGG